MKKNIILSFVFCLCTAAFAQDIADTPWDENSVQTVRDGSQYADETVVTFISEQVDAATNSLIETDESENDAHMLACQSASAEKSTSLILLLTYAFLSFSGFGFGFGRKNQEA